MRDLNPDKSVKFMRNKIALTLPKPLQPKNTSSAG